METLESCPICNSQELNHYITCKDQLVSKEDFSIAACSECGFKFTNPRPVEAALGKYYESDEYVSHSNTDKGFINKAYQIVRKYALGKKLALANQLVKGTEKSILDIGCGTGEFLNYCQSNKWQTLGIEPNDKARNFAKENYNIDVFPEEHLNQLKEHAFSVISMWHVLEHVPRLNDRVGELKKLLKPSGRLIIAVPNCSSMDAQYYKEHWAAYDVPRHLYHFTPDTIKKLFAKVDMKVERILPMKFDSFYVSMLSEQHKNGHPKNLKAAWIGLRSNLAAIKSGETYSSQIYIIRN